MIFSYDSRIGTIKGIRRSKTLQIGVFCLTANGFKTYLHFTKRPVGLEGQALANTVWHTAELNLILIISRFVLKQIFRLDLSKKLKDTGGMNLLSQLHV